MLSTMILKTSQEWFDLIQDKWELVVSLPDGWDKDNWKYSWYKEEIDVTEFMKRLEKSTIRFDKHKFGNWEGIVVSKRVVLNEKGEPSACNECGWRPDYHREDCSQVTVEMLRSKVKHLKRILEEMGDEVDKREETIKKLKNQVTFWQGKFLIVKNENNKMRKKYLQPVVQAERVGQKIVITEDCPF